jgi:sporulation protein YlmC with PRC-barrel domain
MSAKTNIWLATASALALLAGPAFAQDTTTTTTTDGANVTIVNPDGPAERTGEAIDNAARDAGQAIDNAATATGNAARDMTAETGEALEEAGQSMQEAAQPTVGTTAETTTTTTTVETEAAAADGTPVEGQIFQQSPNEYLASTLMAANVRNPNGDNIGDVNDMIIDGDDGRVTGVVIGVGGFLGIGQKDVAIQLDRIEITQDGDNPRDLRFVLNATEDELKDAPAFRTQRDLQNEADANAVGTGMTSTTTSQPPATAAQ